MRRDLPLARLLVSPQLLPGSPSTPIPDTSDPIRPGLPTSSRAGGTCSGSTAAIQASQRRALAEKPGSTLVARSAALRSYFMQTSRFAPSREAPLQRDLAEVRRRRLEQANRNADEIQRRMHLVAQRYAREGRDAVEDAPEAVAGQ